MSKVPQGWDPLQGLMRLCGRQGLQEVPWPPSAWRAAFSQEHKRVQGFWCLETHSRRGDRPCSISGKTQARVWHAGWKLMR